MILFSNIKTCLAIMPRYYINMNSIMPRYMYMAQALDTIYQFEFQNAKVHGTGTRHYIDVNSIMPRYMAQALDTISI